MRSQPPLYPELSPGTLVSGRFALLERIGEGGMGAVWRARHRVTGGEVAIKTLGVKRADVRERFIREARIIASLRHRHLIRVHDVLELPDGRPVMIMELLEGETLADRLDRDGCLTIQELARWLAPVADAVRHAHQHGVVHRDLKPENIFLAHDGEQPLVPKVLDFGIAKVGEAFDHTGKITKTGSVLGTPTYMAPEQVYGESDIDGQADVWSLGMTFYEALTGVCPTEAENVGQVFKAVVQRDFRDLSEIRPEYPRALTTLVDRMLHARREQRPSLDEVLEVLHRLPGAEAVRPAPATRDAVRGPTSRPPSPPARRRWGAVAGVAIGLGAGALGFRALLPPAVAHLEAALDPALLELKVAAPEPPPMSRALPAQSAAVSPAPRSTNKPRATSVVPAPAKPPAEKARSPQSKRGGVYVSNPYE